MIETKELKINIMILNQTQSKKTDATFQKHCVFINVNKKNSISQIKKPTKMKLKHLLSLLLMLALSSSLFSQGLTQTVKGTITDNDTKVTLPGANIVITDMDPLVGAISDLDGNFIIENVPIGRHDIKISYIGYEDVFYSEIVLITGSELVLNVSMIESVNTLDEVVISAKNEAGEPINSFVTLSAQQLTIESTSRIAAGINDPSRTVQSYAGVSVEDDENNEIIVRGNSPRGMLWRMEGIEIPNPNHFSNGEGSTGGGVSALSTQVLDNSDFYTGAFSAEYGNAISSVFDLRLRTGNDTKHEYTFQAGVLGLQAAVEGPFSKKSKASFLFNYRYSTTSLLNATGFSIGGESTLSPEWQDLSFNINLPTKNAGRFSVWGLGGFNQSAETAVKDSSTWQYRFDNVSYVEKQWLGIVGVSNIYLLKNNKSYFKNVVAYSYTNNIQDEDTLNFDYVSTQIVNDEFIYKTLTASSLFNHKFNAKNTIRTGLIFSNQTYNLYARRYNWDDQKVETEIDQTGETNRMQAYFQWKYRITERLDMNTGVHATYLALNSDYSIEPRFGMSYKTSPRTRATFGVGLHSKTEAASIYTAQQTLDNGSVIEPNLDLKMTKAFHIVGGYNWNFGENWLFKTELYYQYLYDVPIMVNDTTGTISSLNFSSGFTNEDFNNEGTGRNYGLEITVEKNFSNLYYFLFTTSLFQSKYTMPGFEERNTTYNSMYILNLVGGKEFKVGTQKQNIISLNLRSMLRGGYRTIPINLEESIAQNEDVRNYEEAFTTKVPDYFRIDLGVSYRKNKPSWSWILSADIQNVTGRNNVWGEYYNAEAEKVETVYLTGLIPVINYKIEF